MKRFSQSVSIALIAVLSIAIYSSIPGCKPGVEVAKTAEVVAPEQERQPQPRMIFGSGGGSAGGGGGGTLRSVNAVSVDTAAGSTASTDYVYLVTGAHTITLPTAVGNTNLYTVKRVGSGTTTIATTSAQTIDGSATVTLTVQYQSLSFISDGANWNLL